MLSQKNKKEEKIAIINASLPVLTGEGLSLSGKLSTKEGDNFNISIPKDFIVQAGEMLRANPGMLNVPEGGDAKEVMSGFIRKAYVMNNFESIVGQVVASKELERIRKKQNIVAPVDRSVPSGGGASVDSKDAAFSGLMKLVGG